MRLPFKIRWTESKPSPIGKTTSGRLRDRYRSVTAVLLPPILTKGRLFPLRARMVPVHQRSKTTRRRAILSLSVALLAIFRPVVSMPEEPQSSGHAATEGTVSVQAEKAEKTSEPDSGSKKK